MKGDLGDVLRFLLHGMLYTFYYSSLPLCAHLLRALEGDERKLKIVGSLLQRSLMSWLEYIY